MERSIFFLALFLVSSLASGGGPPRSDGGSIRVVNPKAIALKDGCYLSEKLVDLKTKKYVEPGEWVSHFFPLPTDFRVTKTKKGYEFNSARDISMTPSHFLFNFDLNEKTGAYEGFVCVKDSKWGTVKLATGCITEIDVENEDVFSVQYGNVTTRFVNIEKFSSEKPQTTEFGPCEWP